MCLVVRRYLRYVGKNPAALQPPAYVTTAPHEIDTTISYHHRGARTALPRHPIPPYQHSPPKVLCQGGRVPQKKSRGFFIQILTCMYVQYFQPLNSTHHHHHHHHTYVRIEKIPRRHLLVLTRPSYANCIRTRHPPTTKHRKNPTTWPTEKKKKETPTDRRRRRRHGEVGGGRGFHHDGNIYLYGSDGGCCGGE